MYVHQSCMSMMVILRHASQEIESALLCGYVCAYHVHFHLGCLVVLHHQVRYDQCPHSDQPTLLLFLLKEQEHPNQT